MSTLREKQPRGAQLELIVKAKNKAFAKKKLQDAKAPGISYYKYEKITDGIFRAYLPCNTCEKVILDSKQIAKIEKNGIFILHSDYSRKKSLEIYQKYAEIETNTRVLLMMTLSLMSGRRYGAFFDTVIKDLKHKHTQNITSQRHSIATTVNRLTLGEVVIILGLDYGAILRRERLSGIIEDLLRDADSFDDFKKQYKDGIKSKYIWDDIGVLLENKITTHKMKKSFEPILDVRNEVAHSRIIGQDDYERFMDGYRTISPIINPSNYKELDGHTREEFTRSCEEAFETLFKAATVNIDGATEPLIHPDLGHGDLGLFRG